MKWDKMTPRQRDALVAWKVMELSFDYSAMWLEDKLEVEYIEETINPQVPHYTTSMDAAWKLVSHCGIRAIVLEHIFCKTTDIYGDDVLLWQCRFEYGGTSDKAGKPVSSTALTPPEAICKATLRAMGAEIA